MDLENHILEKYNIKLYNEDYSICDIINDFLNNNQNEQPFYIIDIGEIIKSYKKWIACFPNIKPYYAVKSNPNKNILNLLNQHGVNFDCASKNELYTVVNSFKKPKQIIFANPCKMIEHIKYAKNKNIDLMTFDSYEELKKI